MKRVTGFLGIIAIIAVLGCGGSKSSTSSSGPITALKITPTTQTLYRACTYQFQTTVTPSSAASEVSWESDNTSVATVNSTGLVPVVGVGSVNISVTANEGSVVATCACTVSSTSATSAYGTTGGMIETYSGLDSLVLFPSSINGTEVTSFGYDSCWENSVIKGIILPTSTTTIGGCAFMSTSLTNVLIPSNVTFIDNDAFDSCSSLTSVTVQATTPPALGTNIFYSDSALATIYVPSASLSAYKTATNWSAYASLMVGY